MEEIVRGAYYTGGEGNDVVLRVSHITPSQMIHCNRYNRKGEFEAEDVVSVRYFKKWAQRRVKPKNMYRSFEPNKPRAAHLEDRPSGDLGSNPWGGW